MRAYRVVLVIPRQDTAATGGKPLASLLDKLAVMGWTIVGIIDPAQHLDALRMILDGVADTVVALRDEDMPSLRFASGLSDGSRGEQRTKMLPRGERARTAEVVESLGPMGPVPTNERPARELAKVSELSDTRVELVERQPLSVARRRQLERRPRAVRRTA